MTDATPLQLAVRLAIQQSGKTRDHWDKILQKRLNTSGKPLYDIDRGKSKRPGMDVMEAIADIFGKPMSFFSKSPQMQIVVEPDQQPTRSADAGETAAVMRMDLSYAMGPGTNVDEHYIEGEPIVFDISFLRQLTPSPPSQLRVVDGTGDSMFPTIHDRDWLILDLAQRTLNMQDRIWALSLDGAGAVKRLQTAGKGKVLVISDNPDVPNREAAASDIVLVGRVVGSIKRH